MLQINPLYKVVGYIQGYIMGYKIVVEWYKTISCIERGLPCKVVDSRFTENLTLKDAITLKSKMSGGRVNGFFRINKIMFSNN